MRNVVLFTLLFAFSSTLFGQVCFEQNALRIADEIVKQQIEYKEPGDCGENVFWDFSQIRVINDSYSLNYSACSDTVSYNKCIGTPEVIVGMQHATAYQYLQKKDSLFLIGYYNPILSMNYDKPLLSMIYPLNYGESAEETYACSGFYSSEDTIREKGTMYLHADAIGELLLPSGDTLNHVLRVKMLHTIVHVDSLHIEEIDKKIMVESYSWYIQGYRYPIFESTRSCLICDSSRQELFKTAFFYSPEEQEYLPDDPVNHVLREEENILISRTSKSVGANLLSKNDLRTRFSSFDCRVYPNPVIDMINVEYMLEKGSKVQAVLYSNDGKVLFDSSLLYKKKGTHNLSIPCEALFPGTYVLHLISDSNTITKKITKTE
ncbi:T9SS type A sorting domain-containing protein [Bacteroides sp.]